jgi:hypothetical protein
MASLTSQGGGSGENEGGLKQMGVKEEQDVVSVVERNAKDKVVKALREIKIYIVL